MAGYRTPSGAPTAEARLKFSVFNDGSYPVWDRQSAESAIRLRGRLSPEKMRKLLRACVKYAPEMARQAMKDEGFTE